mmetsp:Transcript_65091/g.209791  ORF Transcript_65091/g.209791 Transcript_65091/m.209791 type:complete len:423 (-) Transcript_65091:710-1978(-)
MTSLHRRETATVASPTRGSRHDAVVFHAVVPCVRLRHEKRPGCLAVRQDAPDVLVDAVVWVHVRKQQLCALPGVIARESQRLLVLAVHAPERGIDWRIWAPPHVLRGRNLVGVLADHRPQGCLDLCRILSVHHVDELEVQLLFCRGVCGRELVDELLQHGRLFVVGAGDRWSQLLREGQRIWTHARKEAVEAVPFTVAVDCPDVGARLVMALRVGNLAPLQQGPVLGLGVERCMLEGLLNAARREVSGAPAHAAVHLQRGSYLWCLGPARSRCVIGTDGLANDFGLRREAVREVDAAEDLAAALGPDLVVQLGCRPPRDLDGVCDAHGLRTAAATPHVPDANLDEHGPLLRIATKVQWRVHENAGAPAVGGDKAPVAALVLSHEWPDSQQLPAPLLLQYRDHQLIHGVVAGVGQVGDLLELQ